MQRYNRITVKSVVGLVDRVFYCVARANSDDERGPANCLVFKDQPRRARTGDALFNCNENRCATLKRKNRPAERIDVA